MLRTCLAAAGLAAFASADCPAELNPNSVTIPTDYQGFGAGNYITNTTINMQLLPGVMTTGCVNLVVPVTGGISVSMNLFIPNELAPGGFVVYPVACAFLKLGTGVGGRGMDFGYQAAFSLAGATGIVPNCNSSMRDIVTIPTWTRSTTAVVPPCQVSGAIPPAIIGFGQQLDPVNNAITIYSADAFSFNFNMMGMLGIRFCAVSYYQLPDNIFNVNVGLASVPANCFSFQPGTGRLRFVMNPTGTTCLPVFVFQTNQTYDVPYEYMALQPSATPSGTPVATVTRSENTSPSVTPSFTPTSTRIVMSAAAGSGAVSAVLSSVSAIVAAVLAVVLSL